ncbi:MAG: MFS transporter, partial [Rhodospirillaceae bacterium]|nr:MFS transporter [Rhodospirillaceae bacterium]
VLATSRLSPRQLMSVLVLAGMACCIAMSMPQVHIVAYCGDLGYGAQRGAEMLSLMLGLGVISRLISGVIADKIGGLGTLMLGSILQGLALVFYLPFDGLMPLYIVSGLFGLAQGGIVPSYALIVREYFPAREAGAKVSLVLMATVAGMAVGGWMSGEIYDLTGSYKAAFINGIAFNLLNVSIAFWLVMGRRRMATQAA